MGIYETKTFKSGNSVAVRLPRTLGIAANTPVTIERSGDMLTIRTTFDPAEARRQLKQMLDDLRAIGRPGHIQDREEITFDFPDRPGLY